MGIQSSLISLTPWVQPPLPQPTVKVQTAIYNTNFLVLKFIIAPCLYPIKDIYCNSKKEIRLIIYNYHDNVFYHDTQKQMSCLHRTEGKVVEPPACHAGKCSEFDSRRCNQTNMEVFNYAIHL